jgi:TonB family protein
MISTDLLSNLLPWCLQVAAVVAVASLLPWLFRLDAAGVRYVYWRGVAVVCLALPWIQPYRTLPATTHATAAADAAIASTTANAVARTVPQLSWELLLFWVLAIGIVVRFGWLTGGLIRLRTVRRHANRHAIPAIDGELQKVLGTHAAIRYVRDIEQPITFGLFRPIVMLPETLCGRPREIQEAVLGHELLHVKRRDWAWLIVEELAVCLFWFHPASWWLTSRIQHAREEVVDELAIQLTGRRKAYVEALLTFSDATSVVPTAAFAQRRHLFRRIALVSKERVMSSRQIVATCAAMALIVGAGSWYAVSAFPLQTRERTTNLSSVLGSMQPGPLELKAHSVTPENPVPRRVYYEAPVLPASAASARGAMGIKVTLDEVGRVAEARFVDIAFRGDGSSIEASEVVLRERGARALVGYAKADDPNRTPAAQEALVAIVDAAMTSVRAWRYDPPFEAPLTFTVQVPFGEPIMEFKPRSEGGALRVGGDIKPPKKIKDVRPVYPPVAREAGISGVVIIEAKIGADGFIEDAYVLKSIPLLDEAALDAVKQWQFEPTLVNGQPTPVIMTVTINFYADK